MVPRSTPARDRMLAAYALVCVNDTDLDLFKENLDEYTKGIMETVALDLLDHLGLGEEVSVEVVHLTTEQTRKLEQSGTLEDYLLTKGKAKDECDG